MDRKAAITFKGQLPLLLHAFPIPRLTKNSRACILYHMSTHVIGGRRSDDLMTRQLRELIHPYLEPVWNKADSNGHSHMNLHKLLNEPPLLFRHNKDRLLKAYDVPDCLQPLYLQSLELAMESTNSEDENLLRNQQSLMAEVKAAIQLLHREGKISSKREQYLRAAFAAILATPSTNRMLQQALTINDVPELRTLSIEAVITPDSGFDVCLLPQVDRYIIVMSVASLCSIQNALLLWRGCLAGSVVSSPSAFFSEYSKAILNACIPKSVPISGPDVFKETNPLWEFAKTFLIAHELGHIILERSNETFADEREEEYAADKLGWGLYYQVALMLTPPFSTMFFRGELKTAAQRRDFFKRHYSSISSLLPETYHGPFPPQLTGALLQGGNANWQQLLAGWSVEQRSAAAYLANMTFVVPLLLFCILEIHERHRVNAGIRFDSHPPAFDRIKAILSPLPPIVCRTVLKQLDEPLKFLFPAIADKLYQLIP